MIVLNLSCENEHLFEGWFASSDAYARQAESGLVSCPTCGSTHIERRPTSPYVNTGHHKPPAVPAQSDVAGAPVLPAETVAAFTQWLRNAGKQAEDVGANFPEEARRIHYGESEERAIRGQASRDELSELLEEGIMVLPLPPGEEDLH
jgi:hypothetical protein